MDKNNQENHYPWYKSYDPGVPRHIIYPDICVHQLFDAAVAVNPSHPCLIFGNGILTYGEVQAYSIAYARKLASMGVKPGDRVGMALPNCPKFVIAFFAILRTGAIVTAMNPFSTSYEIHYQAKDSGVSFVIGDIFHESVLLDAIKPTAVKTLILEDCSQFQTFFSRVLKTDPTGTFVESGTGDQGLSESFNLPIVSPDAHAIFQYSGGTTGVPKAAIGTHRGMVANIYQFSIWLTGLVHGGETWLSAIPFYHVYGMVIALCVGLHKQAVLVVLPDARNMEAVVKAAVTHKATFLPAVPALFSGIIRYLEMTGQMDEQFCIKVCISGSASLHEKVKNRFEELTGSRILEGYGLSEAPTATHCNPLQGDNRIGSIGLPLPDVICRIVDTETGMQQVAPGMPGELIIKGPQVMFGYHNQTAEDQQALRNGWLFTGDIARMDDDGYFYIIDRKKDIIKIGGFQVWPKEIESVLMLHPAVLEAAVAGKIQPEDNQEIIHAWIVLRQGEQATGEELQNWCSEILSHYKIPRVFHFVNGLPKSSVGKVLRRELRAAIL